jgi:hypothetical protein
MGISNPLQMNDWGIRRYILTVVLLQVGMWGSLAWDAVGIDMPLVKRLHGLPSVILLLGVGIRRVVELHNPGRNDGHRLSHWLQSSCGQGARGRQGRIHGATMPEVSLKKQVGGSRWAGGQGTRHGRRTWPQTPPSVVTHVKEVMSH